MGEVRLENRNGVAVLTLDNPPLNVLSVDMGRKIRAAVDQVGTDNQVFAVVITGQGNRAFMAGADIKEFPEYIAQGIAEEMALQFDETMTRLYELGKPTIAALNGVTLGGGLELALACDFRIAEEQIQIGFPEVKLGVFPGAGGTQRLPRLIGVSRAKELILTGEPIDAASALQIGLVNRVVPKGQALTSALAFVEVFRERSLASVRRAKLAIDQGMEGTLEAGLRLEAKLFGEVFETKDAREGISAFMEKRKPRFEHR
ncbi:MAG: enoyl-CoA hydratase [Alicyclobacillus macrosporangiidus]|uniref:enoyl-CoA hydratase/isomerase family protein n=1 Tax=Alicyclobacillus TaxID=29330 RepID=UPI00041D4E98|nr:MULTISPECIES: enoyl-CoA hydratase [Alicyclobacillus]MCL6597861.1 enoyl-CoA hydratase [Alicyclobacillus macrosporangiidus]